MLLDACPHTILSDSAGRCSMLGGASLRMNRGRPLASTAKAPVHRLPVRGRLFPCTIVSTEYVYIPDTLLHSRNSVAST